MTKLKLNLKNYTPKQYAALILREDFGYTHEMSGKKMEMTKTAFASLYKRAKDKK